MQAKPHGSLVGLAWCGGGCAAGRPMAWAPEAWAAGALDCTLLHWETSRGEGEKPGRSHLLSWCVLYYCVAAHSFVHWVKHAHRSHPVMRNPVPAVRLQLQLHCMKNNTLATVFSVSYVRPVPPWSRHVAARSHLPDIQVPATRWGSDGWEARKSVGNTRHGAPHSYSPTPALISQSTDKWQVPLTNLIPLTCTVSCC